MENTAWSVFTLDALSQAILQMTQLQEDSTFAAPTAEAVKQFVISAQSVRPPAALQVVVGSFELPDKETKAEITKAITDATRALDIGPIALIARAVRFADDLTGIAIGAATGERRVREDQGDDVAIGLYDDREEAADSDDEAFIDNTVFEYDPAIYNEAVSGGAIPEPASKDEQEDEQEDEPEDDPVLANFKQKTRTLSAVDKAAAWEDYTEHRRAFPMFTAFDQTEYDRVVSLLADEVRSIRDGIRDEASAYTLARSKRRAVAHIRRYREQQEALLAQNDASFSEEAAVIAAGPRRLRTLAAVELEAALARAEAVRDTARAEWEATRQEGEVILSSADFDEQDTIAANADADARITALNIALLVNNRLTEDEEEELTNLRQQLAYARRVQEVAVRQREPRRRMDAAVAAYRAAQVALDQATRAPVQEVTIELYKQWHSARDTAKRTFDHHVTRSLIQLEQQMETETLAIVTTLHNRQEYTQAKRYTYRPLAEPVTLVDTPPVALPPIGQEPVKDRLDQMLQTYGYVIVRDVRNATDAIADQDGWTQTALDQFALVQAADEAPERIPYSPGDGDFDRLTTNNDDIIGFASVYHDERTRTLRTAVHNAVVQRVFRGDAFRGKYVQQIMDGIEMLHDSTREYKTYSTAFKKATPMAREYKTYSTAFKRTATMAREPGTTVYRGWLNLCNYDDVLDVVPGSHNAVVSEPYGALSAWDDTQGTVRRLVPESRANGAVQRISVPIGAVLLMHESLAVRHVQHKDDYGDDYEVRLRMTWAITANNALLMQNVQGMLNAQDVPVDVNGDYPWLTPWRSRVILRQRQLADEVLPFGASLIDLVKIPAAAYRIALRAGDAEIPVPRATLPRSMRITDARQRTEVTLRMPSVQELRRWTAPRNDDAVDMDAGEDAQLVVFNGFDRIPQEYEEIDADPFLYPLLLE